MKIYNELISAGKVPDYVDYEDLGSIFDSAVDYAGANVEMKKSLKHWWLSSAVLSPTETNSSEH